MTSTMNKCLSVRCTQHQSSRGPKTGAMYRCYVQDPTGYILAAFYRLGSVYSQLQSTPAKEAGSIPKQSPTSLNMVQIYNRTLAAAMLLISRSAGVLANHGS
jgi:hypothetical protein